MLGNQVVEILEELKMIKRRLAFTVTSDSQPIQQAVLATLLPQPEPRTPNS